jgi:hypothetical protein
MTGQCIAYGKTALDADPGVRIVDGPVDGCALFAGAGRCQYPESDWDGCPRRREMAAPQPRGKGGSKGSGKGKGKGKEQETDVANTVADTKTKKSDPRKPTLEELVKLIPEDDAKRIYEGAIRLIHIQDELKTLEREKGFTDPNSKIHTRGLVDEIYDALAMWGFDGVRIEDFLCYRMDGERPYIDKIELLNLGVDPVIIEKATKRTSFRTVICRKSGEKGA